MSSAPLPKRVVKPRVRVVRKGQPVPQTGNGGGGRRRRKNRGRRVKAGQAGAMVRVPVPLQTSITSKMRVIHTEYILSLGTDGVTTTPVIQNMLLNPRNSLFPWASSIANLFDRYLVNRFTVRYVPTCSTLTDGSVLMVFDYDPTDSPEGMTYSRLANWGGKVEGALYQPLALSWSRANSDQSVHPMYCDAGALEGDRFAHFARLYLCVQSATAGIKGRIFFDYDFVFSCPETSGPTYEIGSSFQQGANGITTGTFNASKSCVGPLPKVVAKHILPGAQQALAKTIESNVQQLVYTILESVTLKELIVAENSGFVRSARIFPEMTGDHSDPVVPVSDIVPALTVNIDSQVLVARNLGGRGFSVHWTGTIANLVTAPSVGLIPHPTLVLSDALIMENFKSDTHPVSDNQYVLGAQPNTYVDFSAHFHWRNPTLERAGYVSWYWDPAKWDVVALQYGLVRVWIDGITPDQSQLY